METVNLAAPLVHERHRYATILRLALPTVVAMLSQSIVNEIDVVFFSHLPCPESSNGQAALLPSLILVWLFGGSLSALSVGTQAIVARRYAEGDRKAAGAVLTNAAFFCFTAGTAFTVIGIVCLPWLVKTMIGVREVQNVALEYTRWRLLGVVSMSATMAIKSFFDGLGKTHVHLVAALVMNVANVVLCWMFIFGHGGAPRMGAPGAGLSAFIATWIGLGIMIGYAALVRDEYQPIRWSNLSGKLTKAILSLSIPAAAATVIMMVGFGLFARTAGQLDATAAGSAGAGGTALGQCGGVEAVNSAANTDIVETLKLTFTACIAFGTATATLIGQSLGRRRPDEAAKWGWASVRLGFVLFGIVEPCEGVFFTGEQVVGFLLELSGGARRGDVPDAHHGAGHAGHRGRAHLERRPVRRGVHPVRGGGAAAPGVRLARAGRLPDRRRPPPVTQRHLDRRLHLRLHRRRRDEREVRRRQLEEDQAVSPRASPKPSSAGRVACATASEPIHRDSRGDRTALGADELRSRGDRTRFGADPPRSRGDRTTFGAHEPRSRADRTRNGAHEPRSRGDRTSFGAHEPRSRGDGTRFGTDEPRSTPDRTSPTPSTPTIADAQAGA